MPAVCSVLFVVSFLSLLVSGTRFLLQSPLRKRGVTTWGYELSRSIPKDGKIDVWYGYDAGDGELHSLGMFGNTTSPGGSQQVIYDPQKPKRAAFVSDMPTDVKRRKIYLACLAGVAALTLALGLALR